MYLEYDWTFDVYRPRFGHTFTEWRGQRSFETLEDVKHAFSLSRCKLGRKTDSRTWEIVAEEVA